MYALHIVVNPSTGNRKAHPAFGASSSDKAIGLARDRSGDLQVPMCRTLIHWKLWNGWRVYFAPCQMPRASELLHLYEVHPGESTWHEQPRSQLSRGWTKPCGRVSSYLLVHQAFLSPYPHWRPTHVSNRAFLAVYCLGSTQIPDKDQGGTTRIDRGLVTLVHNDAEGTTSIFPCRLAEQVILSAASHVQNHIGCRTLIDARSGTPFP